MKKAFVLLAFAAACSSAPDEGDSGVSDGGDNDGGIADAGGSDSGRPDSGLGDSGLIDGSVPEEFCKASTPQSDLHEGACRNDDGTIDRSATGSCLVDRDYMEFF